MKAVFTGNREDYCKSGAVFTGRKSGYDKLSNWVKPRDDLLLGGNQVTLYNITTLKTWPELNSTNESNE